MKQDARGGHPFLRQVYHATPPSISVRQQQQQQQQQQGADGSVGVGGGAVSAAAARRSLQSRVERPSRFSTRRFFFWNIKIVICPGETPVTLRVLWRGKRRHGPRLNALSRGRCGFVLAPPCPSESQTKPGPSGCVACVGGASPLLFIYLFIYFLFLFVCAQKDLKGKKTGPDIWMHG